VIGAGAAAIVLAGSLLAAAPLGAQEMQSDTPQIDETTVALSWLRGRFLRPVTCMREDGTRVDLEEAMVIRPSTARSGMPVLRVTFFGIDLASAEKCFNLVEREIPDRRGVLYLTYRSRRRTDTGMADFKRTIKGRELRYHVVDEEFRIRPVGQPDIEPRVIRFGKGDYPLLVRPILPHSDGAKLLEQYRDDDNGPDPRRRLRFELEGPDEFRFGAAFIEDDSRWK
jgi:hypothetical protein